MLEDLAERAEFELRQQAPQLLLGGVKVRIVGQTGLPVEGHPRMTRIEFPWVNVEHDRSALCLERPIVRPGDLEGVEPEIGASRHRNTAAEDLPGRERQFVDWARGGLDPLRPG